MSTRPMLELMRQGVNTPFEQWYNLKSEVIHCDIMPTVPHSAQIQRHYGHMVASVSLVNTTSDTINVFHLSIISCWKRRNTTTRINEHIETNLPGSSQRFFFFISSDDHEFAEMIKSSTNFFCKNPKFEMLLTTDKNCTYHLHPKRWWNFSKGSHGKRG